MVSRGDLEIKNLINQIIDGLSNSSNLSEASQIAIGLAIWDICSNNNIIINASGTELDLGTWRDAAECIADLINAKWSTAYDSEDFYQGTDNAIGVRSVDQVDHYTEIFLLLHELGYDWRCASQIEFNVCVMDGYTVQAYKSVYRK